MIEWIRFGLTAALIAGGLFFFLSGVVGQYRFRYVLNRMHAASMGDTLGLIMIMLGLSISHNDGFVIAKCLITCLFVLLTSPTASHLIARLEIATNEHPEKEMELIRK
ncbi:MAG: monovalent cation/H(+) antiporter subunit G [Clostridiales bacterium]|nr:monovalent cation/H(+) antiporter subunit G [Clostridiales bacterium]